MGEGMVPVVMVRGWLLVGQGTPQSGTNVGVRHQLSVPGVRSGAGHCIDLLVFQPLQPLELLVVVFAHLLDGCPAGHREGAHHGLLQTSAPCDRHLVVGLRNRSQELSWHGGPSRGIPLTGIHVWDGPHLGVTGFSLTQTMWTSVTD